MTDQEDAENACRNEVILACKHEICFIDGGYKCSVCLAQFAVMLLPRLNRVPPISLEDEV